MNNEILGAISIRQPYAWAVVTGLKKFENRSRPIRKTGRLIIHSSRTEVSDEEYDEFYALDSILYPMAEDPYGDDDDVLNLNFGAIIGSVEIYNCRDIREIDYIHKHYRDQHDHISGKYVYHLRNPKRYHLALQCKGSTNIPWKLTPWQMDFVKSMEEEESVKGLFTYVPDVEKTEDSC